MFWGFTHVAECVSSSWLLLDYSMLNKFVQVVNPIDGYLGCYEYSCYKHTCLKFFVDLTLLFLLGKYLEEKLLGHRVSICLNLL